MRRDALVAFGITEHGLLRIDVAKKLRLHSLEARLELRIDRLVPSGIALQLLLERLDALR